MSIIFYGIVTCAGILVIYRFRKKRDQFWSYVRKNMKFCFSCGTALEIAGGKCSTCGYTFQPETFQIEGFFGRKSQKIHYLQNR